MEEEILAGVALHRVEQESSSEAPEHLGLGWDLRTSHGGRLSVDFDLDVGDFGGEGEGRGCEGLKYTCLDLSSPFGKLPM